MATGGIQLIDTFRYSGKKYLDLRQQCDTLEELKATSEQSIPDGFTKYCAEDGCWYEYNSQNEEWDDTGRWRKASPISESLSEEYIFAITDTEDNLLLGIRYDGEVVYNKGMSDEVKEQFDETGKRLSTLESLGLQLTDDESYLFAIADKGGNLLLGINSKGEVVYGKGMSDEVKEQFDETGKRLSVLESLGLQLTDDESYLFAIADKGGNLLLGINSKGEVVYGKGMSDEVKEQFDETGKRLSVLESLGLQLTDDESYLFAIADKGGNLLLGINSKGEVVYGKGVPDEVKEQFDETGKRLSTLESLTSEARLETDDSDNECIYKITDKDGLIVFAVNWNGKTYIPKGIPEEQKEENTDMKQRLTDLEKSLAGFTGGTGDWSDAESMQIPIPKCAVLNILSGTMPTAKSGAGTSGVDCDIPCQVEFWDMQGNYFKKWVLMSAQGNSSMSFTKKNLALDFFMSYEDAASDGDTFEMRFGDWVPQDSFHLKAYCTDAFRGAGAVSYLLYEEMAKTRGIADDRPYKQTFTGDYGITDDGGSGSIDDLDKNFDTGAKCFPMPFPVIVHQQGEFYGIYAWQLKKHRDNMWQSKKKAKHIHLDGTLNATTLFGGSIDWTEFEIRNPKDLVTVDGEDYDGDNPTEITGDEEVDEDTAKVKGYITDLSGRIAEIQAEEDGLDAETIQDDYDTITTNHTHSSSTGLSALRSVAFIGSDEWLVYLTKDNTGTNDATLMSYFEARLEAAKGVAAFAEKYPDVEVGSYTEKVWEGSALVDESVWNSLLEQAGLDGYTLDFNGSTGKSYPEGTEISLAMPNDEYPYLKIVNAHGLIADMEEYLTTANDEMRGLIGKYFMPSFMVDYILETNLGGDGDGYGKNWQWTTWDGKLWTANPYDMDGIFGSGHVGNTLSDPPGALHGNTTDIPSGWIIKYFMPELETRWAELRDKGIFDAAHVAGMLHDWCARIGYDNYEKEYERWPESPCNRSSLVNDDNWTRSTSSVSTWAETTAYSLNGTAQKGTRVYKSLVSGNKGNDPETDDGTYWEDVTYDDGKEYSEGDVCYYGKSTFYGFKCTAECQGVPPLSGFYSLYPYELGHYDSVYRVQNWLEKHISQMDGLLGYTAQ